MDQRTGGGLRAEDYGRLNMIVPLLGEKELCEIAELPTNLVRDFKDSAIIFAAQAELDRRGQYAR